MAPAEPPALGLAGAVSVGMACADADPTPLTGRTVPGASATVRDPRAAYAPPATIAKPSTLAAPIMVALLDIWFMPFTPFHALVSGWLQSVSHRGMSGPGDPDERVLISSEEVIGVS